MLLAIDTSTNHASLALLDGAQVVAALDWDVGRQQSVEILGRLDAFLEEAGIAHAALTGLAVATGPGSFNGTRVAVTVAKTLAFVWQLPLVGISTLDGMAQAQVGRGAEKSAILAASEAGREELYYGWYDVNTGLVARQAAIAIAPIAALGSAAPAGRDILLTGEITALHAQALLVALGERAHAAQPLALANRAIGIAQLAAARLAAGEHDDPLTLEPLYVRRPNITTSARHPVPASE